VNCHSKCVQDSSQVDWASLPISPKLHSRTRYPDCVPAQQSRQTSSRPLKADTQSHTRRTWSARTRSSGQGDEEGLHRLWIASSPSKITKANLPLQHDPSPHTVNTATHPPTLALTSLANSTTNLTHCTPREWCVAS
jgi:hypothetical protein